MTEPDGRRGRPAVSCYLCRKRKIRCNREAPCSNCKRSRSEACIYENPKHPPLSPRHHLGQSQAQAAHQQARQSPLQHAQATNTNLTPSMQQPLSWDHLSSRSFSAFSSQPTSSLASASTGATTPPPRQRSEDNAESLRLKLRIRQLEDQLTKPALHSALPSESMANSIEPTSSRLGGTFYLHCENNAGGQSQAIARSLTHKTRLFGQSHWSVNGVSLIRDVFEASEAILLRETTSSALLGIEKCKALARTIKARRAPPWPCPLTTTLPSKHVADALVDCYLRSTETIYRILHIPTFRRDYEALWTSDSIPDTTFIAQLKLVLAIGATTYDDTFSLRPSAVRWVYEAQSWVSEPKFKSRLDTRSLQIDLLLLISAEKVGVGLDAMWISVGALVRKAVYIGLHRDPAFLPRCTTFVAEMRRRLWNTILELCLQSSLTSGGPPFLALHDFDTAAPNNFDDDQLLADDPIPKPPHDFTQVSVARALRKTFPQRLAVTTFLNSLASAGTYDETLRLDAELRIAYKDLVRSLHIFRRDTSQTPSPSLFEIHAIDFLMHRYLSSLHVPYFGPALRETAYAFSRRVVVESSLKIWRAVFPTSLYAACAPHVEVAPSEWNELPRLAACSSGFYPTVAIHAAFLIAVELRAQLQEEEEGSLGFVTLRPDLLVVLEEVKTWCLRVIAAGETNVKGLLLMSVVAAQIEGMMRRGLGREQMGELVVQAAELVGVQCLPILERMAAQLGGRGDEGRGEMVESMEPKDLLNFMTSDDGMFDIFEPDGMDVMLGDGMNQAPW